MRSTKRRSTLKVALMTLLVVGLFALLLGSKFHQHSWIEKSVLGAADPNGSPP